MENTWKNHTFVQLQCNCCWKFFWAVSTVKSQMSTNANFYCVGIWMQAVDSIAAQNGSHKRKFYLASIIDSRNNWFGLWLIGRGRHNFRRWKELKRSVQNQRKEILRSGERMRWKYFAAQGNFDFTSLWFSNDWKWFFFVQIFTRPKDEVGLLLLGTNETDNEMNKDCGGYKNISWAFPISPVSWDSLRFVAKSLPAPNNDDVIADWLDGIVVAVDQLKRSECVSLFVWCYFISILSIFLNNFPERKNVC